MCVHHWRIEPPNGPTSKGQCKKCRAVKDFPNSPIICPREYASKMHSAMITSASMTGWRIVEGRKE